MRYKNVEENDKRKTVAVTFFLSEEELREMDRKAGEMGMSRSAYIRHRTIYDKEG